MKLTFFPLAAMYFSAVLISLVNSAGDPDDITDPSSKGRNYNGKCVPYKAIPNLGNEVKVVWSRSTQNKNSKDWTFPEFESFSASLPILVQQGKDRPITQFYKITVNVFGNGPSNTLFKNQVDLIFDDVPSQYTILNPPNLMVAIYWKDPKKSKHPDRFWLSTALDVNSCELDNINYLASDIASVAVWM